VKPAILVFIDGLGIGAPDPASNPLAAFEPRALDCCVVGAGPKRDGRICLRTDAGLDVPGVPQSATGQTALLTGINAAAALGRHLHGYPNATLRGLLQRESIFRRLLEAGRTVTFANSYMPRFFQNRPRWVSASTVMCESAGVRLNRLEDLRVGQSLYMDFTNRMLIEAGIQVNERTPEEAGQTLAAISNRYDFCFYEYFLTDFVGHRGNFEQAVELLSELDRFLAALVANVDPTHTSIIVTSDHGNIEDARTRQHTSNPVPTILWGPVRELVEGRDNLALTELAGLIMRAVG